MAIIYSYPLVTSIQPSDLLILSVDSSELPTRQVTVGDLLASGAVDVNLNFTADTGTGSVNLSTQSLEVRQGVYITTTATNQELIINHKSTVRQDTNIGDTSPGYGGSFTVIDSVVTDATGSGHVTGVNLKTVTLPAADDTNTTYDLLGYNTGIELVGSDGTRDQIQIVGSGDTTVSQANNIITVSSTSGTGGSGTTNTLAKWTGPTTLGDSIVSESGTSLNVAGNATITGDVQIDTLNNDFIPVNRDPGVLRDSVIYQDYYGGFADPRDKAVGLNTTELSSFYGEYPDLRVASRSFNDPGVLDLFRPDGDVQAGDRVGILQYSLNDDAQYAVAQIEVKTIGNSGTGNTGGGKLCIKTSSNQAGAQVAERLCIDNTEANFSVPINVTNANRSSFVGQVTIPLTPVANTDAASKGYVDLQNQGGVSGSGTTNVLPIWSDGPNSVLSDSLITQTKIDGGTIFDLSAITTGPYTPAVNTKLLDLNSGGAQKFSITQDGGGGVVLPSGGGVTNPGPSFNMGGGAFSNGKSGVAMGSTTTAFGNGSLAANFLTLASGGGASAFGLLTEASALASATFGNKSVASGNYSIAAGQDSIASGQSSVAIGEKGVAQGKNTFVQGFSGTAAGNNAVKFGYDGSASGNNSAKFGFESIASGNNSFASGWQTVASGLYSFTAGDGNIASGERTVAFGLDNNVSGKGSFAIGARNAVPSENSFVGGTDNTLIGASSGVPGAQTSFVFGSGNTAEGTNSTVLGTNNATGESTANDPNNYITIIGHANNNVGGSQCTLIGFDNTANGGNNGYLIGSDNLNQLTSNSYIFGRANDVYNCNSSAIIGTGNEMLGSTNTPSVTLVGVGLKFDSSGPNSDYGRATYVGYYNDETDAYSQFQIGNGTGDLDRKNALSINKDSEIKISEYGSGTVTGTAAWNLAVAADGKIIETSPAGAPDYLSFVCLLSQSGAANPQPNIVLENSLGIPTPFTAFTRVSSGEYNLNATGKFKLLKTIVFLNGGSAENNHDVAWEVIDADNLRIRTHNSDGKLTKASLEIRTYN